ncbi:hypothetical protein [Pseudogemmobacter sp. W21_MBD1_M6]|uniref:hypothetical protein n=1 Tax=Pseudogemmobacter sp. W21_MBD1_M6 TaxID=3240271 RepID=UPI003F9DE687
MRHLALLLILPLAACATPRDQCIGSLPKDTRVLDTLIAETAGNIARGYAVVETPQFTTGLRTCFGDAGVTLCTGTETTMKRKPVAIDLAAEKAKLASMQADRAAKLQELSLRTAQCTAQNPAT